MFNKDKLLNTMVIALAVLGIACIIYVLFGSWKLGRDQATRGNMACVKETTVKEIKDEHLAGLFNEGDKLRVLVNFYQCNNVNRGDWVLFNIANGIEPVIRIVKGIPGDSYDVKEDGTKKGQWLLSINGQELQAGGGPYFIQSNTIPPLRTYQLSRNGVLAQDEYIILSNKPPGLSDSSNLGLVSKASFLGKATDLKN